MWKPSACIPTPLLTICSGSSTGRQREAQRLVREALGDDPGNVA
jgi:hypothetical protein